jgi:glycosyltransferase involved in cell wall biosynthesis
MQKKDNDYAKIAIVADAKGWALHNIAVNIVKNLQIKFNIDIIYSEDYPDTNKLYCKLFSDSSYDIVHFLLRKKMFSPALINPFFQELVSEEIKAAYAKGLSETIITASVYDHLLLDETDIKKHSFYFKYIIDGYTVSSEKLNKTYNQISSYPGPAMVIEDGVDQEKFYPLLLERLVDSKRNIVVGWVGNSLWGRGDGIDHKGFTTIVLPAIQLLIDAELKVEIKAADCNVQMIPHDEMISYYKSIDILVCTSDIEGTPNPILEAMACGIPIISTDVGIVPQVFGKLQKEFILSERTVACLGDKLKQLIESPSMRKMLSDENLKQIVGWTRQDEARKWDIFFSNYINANEKSEHCYYDSTRTIKKCLLEYQSLMVQGGELIRRIKDRPTFIWGAGQAGKKTLEYATEYNINIQGFIDGDSKKEGTLIHNVPVYSSKYLQGLVDKGNIPFVLIGSSYIHAIKTQLEAMGMEHDKDFTDCNFLWT